MARISVESIKESTIKFESKSYFTERNKINDELMSDMQKSFDEKAEGAVEVGKGSHFIIIPSQFRTSVH